MLTSLVPVLFTFYIQDLLKFRKKNNNSGAKGLTTHVTVASHTHPGLSQVFPFFTIFGPNPYEFLISPILNIRHALFIALVYSFYLCFMESTHYNALFSSPHFVAPSLSADILISIPFSNTSLFVLPVG